MTQSVTPLAWDAGFEDETVTLAYEATKELPQLFSNWADAIDNKIVANFTVASALVTLVPTFQEVERTIPVVVCLGLAIGFWAVSVLACYRAYRPMRFRIEPNPRALMGPSWLTKKPMHFRYSRMHWLGETYEHNSAKIEFKAEWLGYAMLLTAGEVFWLALAILLGAPA